MPIDTADRFNALLKLQTGETIASGFGKILITQKAILFESDFVPLYPMGTPMEVVRLFQDKPIHRFCGKVFLSDKHLMKLVSVDDQLLPGAELLYFNNALFSATFTLLPFEQSEKGFLGIFRTKAIEPDLSFYSQITEISDKELVFQYDIERPLEVGHQLVVVAHDPLPLPLCTIEIYKSLCFGQIASYHGKFTNLKEIDKDNLQAFLWQYHMKKSKLF